MAAIRVASKMTASFAPNSPTRCDDGHQSHELVTSSSGPRRDIDSLDLGELFWGSDMLPKARHEHAPTLSQGVIDLIHFK